MSIARSRIGLAAVLALGLAVIGGLVLAERADRPAGPRRPALALPNAAALSLAITPAGIERHMAELQRIAARNGGNRAAGTSGYRQSAAYVAGRLRAAGWRVRELPSPFPYFAERSPPVVRAGGRRLQVATLRFSGSGEARARPTRVGSG
ncbi:MAG TPA: hypothetical protein VIM03_12305, partial [Thermoleophilaceae bacterium]